MTLQLVIDGDGAQDAADELSTLPDLELQIEDQPSEPHKELATLATVATVVAIVGAAAQIADSVLAWHDRWRKRAAPVENVVIVVDGDRRLLEHLTAAELTAMLEGLRRAGDG